MTNQVLLGEEEKYLLAELPEDLLLSIVGCERLKDLDALLQRRCPEKKQRLLAIAKKRSAHIKSSGNKISESLFELLTPMSYVFLIVDTMFTLITAITLVAFAIVSAGLLALVSLIGVVGFIGMYKELKHQEEKNNKKCELLAFQNDCAEMYIKKKLPSEETQFNVRDQAADKKSDNKVWQKTKDWMGTTILVTGALFYTYYAVTLGLTIAFAGSLVIAGMAGPIGIGIALGVACAIGIYFGYKKYQANKKNRILEKDLKKLENEFDTRYKTCRMLNRLDPIATPAPNIAGAAVRHPAVINRSAPSMTTHTAPVFFQKSSGGSHTSLAPRTASRLDKDKNGGDTETPSVKKEPTINVSTPSKHRRRNTI